MKLILVKHSRHEMFDRLCRTFADEPNVKILWERRIGERRRRDSLRGPERRTSDRRRLFKSLQGRDYVVVHTAEPLRSASFAQASPLRSG
jgi:hypothetical protein